MRCTGVGGWAVGGRGGSSALGPTSRLPAGAGLLPAAGAARREVQAQKGRSLFCYLAQWRGWATRRTCFVGGGLSEYESSRLQRCVAPRDRLLLAQGGDARRVPLSSGSMSSFRRSKDSKVARESLSDLLQMVSRACMFVCVGARR